LIDGQSSSPCEDNENAECSRISSADELVAPTSFSGGGLPLAAAPLAGFCGVSALNPSFKPLLDATTAAVGRWVRLCADVFVAVAVGGGGDCAGEVDCEGAETLLAGVWASLTPLQPRLPLSSGQRGSGAVTCLSARPTWSGRIMFVCRVARTRSVISDHRSLFQLPDVPSVRRIQDFNRFPRGIDVHGGVERLQ